MAYKRTNIYIHACFWASIYILPCVRTHTQTLAEVRMRCFFFAEVKDVVHAVMYLLSDKADMINGVTLDVDGGLAAC